MRKHLESFTLDCAVFVQHSPEKAGRGQLVSLIGGEAQQKVSPDGEHEEMIRPSGKKKGKTVRHVFSHSNGLKSEFPQLK